MQQMEGFKFEMLNQVYFNIKGKGYFADFFVPRLMMIFEVDGAMTHRHAGDEISDMIRDEAIYEALGIKTVRFTFHEITRVDFRDKIFQPRVKQFLAQDKYNVFDYYNISPKTRFEGKKSPNQIILEATLGIVKTVRYGDSVVIATPHMYMIEVAGRDKVKGEYAAHKLLLQDIYDAKVGRNISFCFTGNREGIYGNSRHVKIMRRWDGRCAQLPANTPTYTVNVAKRRAVIESMTLGELRTRLAKQNKKF